MNRPSAMVLRTLCVSGLFWASLPLSAGESAKTASTVKPPWQRLLQGEDAKKAAEQEKRLAELQEADQFAEALKVAEELEELRQKAQGADHWEVVNARSEIEAMRRLLKATKQEQQSYRRIFLLLAESNTLTARGRYREAQPLLEQVLTTCRKVIGEEHPETLASAGNLAFNLYMQGKYKEAEEADRKTITLKRKVLGGEHPDTASSYNNLGLDLKHQGKYREAEQSYRQALAIRFKVLGPEHPHTAQSYNNLAANHSAQGKHREAAEGFRKALDIRLKVLGEEHLDTINTYNMLGLNLNAQGQYKEAEEYFRKVVAIYRKVQGENHPDTAIGYNNLALNLNLQGKYQKAEEGARKALAIQRRVLGEEHPNTATSYNNLTSNLNAQGKYTEGEESSRKALAIYRKALGEEHPLTANGYNQLGLHLDAQGKYAEAEESYRKALAIQLRVMGEEHPDAAVSYTNLATVLSRQEKYAQAEEGLSKALAIFRRVLGEEHPRTAHGYNSLAVNQRNQGKYVVGEASARKALAIRRKVLGEEHSDTALAYHNLAANLGSQGKHREAAEAFGKVLAINRKVLGSEHPYTAVGYDSVAINLNAQGKYQEAEEHWRRAAEVFAKGRVHFAATGLERATKTGEMSSLPSLAAVLARNGKPVLAWQRLEESLGRGTWDDVSARLHQSQAERDKQAELNAHIDRLQQLVERVSGVKPTSELTQQRDRLLTQLRQAYDELATYTEQLKEKSGPIAGQVYPRDRIQAALPADAALLGWLDLPTLPKAADPNGEHWAILLRSAGKPIWVRLTGSDDKDAWTDADTQLPATLRSALQIDGSDWQPLAQRLRRQRLDPLAQHLKGVRHLMVLPSTALAGVPVEVFADKYTVSYAHSGTMYAYLRQHDAPTGKGLFALADPIFDPTAQQETPQPLPPGGVLLTMVLPGSNAAGAELKPNDVLLRYNDTDLAGPADFKPLPPSENPDKRLPVIVWRDGETRKQPFYVRPGKLGVVIAKEPAPQALAEQRRWDRKLALRGSDEKLERLPGTRIEVASLQRLFDKDAPLKVLLDSDASEQRLNELAASGELGKYRYLHLATHGEVDNRMPLHSAVILAHDKLPDEKQRTALLLSGQPIPDGRVTAAEALQHWNLHCELVTLSACETALGKYERGEGFVGFAQALILCGTRSVCLSLWKVDDLATALLMDRFYQNLLGKRDGLKAPLSKAAALAEAKSWLRTLPRAEAEKRAASLTEGGVRGKAVRPGKSLEVPPAAVKAKPSDCPFEHPRYWAAFVLIGHAD